MATRRRTSTIPDDSPVHFSYSSHLLEDLGVNLYTSLPKGLVEFVANAYDADSPSVHIRFSSTQIETAHLSCRAEFEAEQKKGYADEIIEIADSVRGGTAEAVAAARLAVDSRKWIASKLLPKKYGERLDLAHSGEVTHKHMTLAQFAERIREAKLLSGRVVEAEAIEGGESGK